MAKGLLLLLKKAVILSDLSPLSPLLAAFRSKNYFVKTNCQQTRHVCHKRRQGKKQILANDNNAMGYAL